MSRYRFEIVTSEAEEVASDWMLINRAGPWTRHLEHRQELSGVGEETVRYVELAVYTITDPVLATEFALRFGEIIGVRN